MTHRLVLCSLLVVFIWGINFSFIKIGLQELPPILFSALRFLIVAIPAILFVPFPKTSVWNVVGVGVFLGILKFGLLFIAMHQDASAGIASLLLQAQVIFTILLSMLLFKETMNRYQAIGILVAFAGFSSFVLNASENVTLTGVILIVAAAFFWSISNIIMKKTGKVNLLHFMVWACLIPPVPLFVASYIYESQQPVQLILASSTSTWLALAYVSYISTLIAFALWGWLLRNYQAAQVTPFALLIPIIGVIGSTLILGESLTTLELIGASFILLGLIVCVIGKPLTRLLWQHLRQSMTK